MPHVRVWVDDADVLEEMSDDELLKELAKRKVKAPDSGWSYEDAKEAVQKIYYALYFGKESEALALTRKYVQDVTGKVLP